MQTKTARREITMQEYPMRQAITHNRPMFRAVLLLSLIAVSSRAQSPETSDWGHYGGDIFAQRYSSLAEIHRGNVAKLEVRWRYRTGEQGAGLKSADKLAFEATPVLAFGNLYLATPTNIVIALDPARGTERWRYDPRIDRAKSYSVVSSRGVSVWEDSNAGPHCARRVFIGTLDARLIALDAQTGQLCASFGRGGMVKIQDAGGAAGAQHHSVISPPAIYDDFIIVNSPSGGISAFDARSGMPRWTLATLPGAAALAVDPDRGLVFAPTANALLALEAATGKLAWRQELIHKDLWGFDLTAQPTLVDLELNGSPVPAVLQATRTGMLFVFGRGSGKPIFPIVEQRVPAGGVGAVAVSPTQPFPVTPALVGQHRLEPSHGWGIMFWDRAKCRELLRRHRNEGIFTPPGPRGAILWPSPASGIGWGGVAFDARRQRMIAAVNHMPMLATPAGAAPLLSPFGLPCTPPPWGTLASIDLAKNQVVWQVPLGTTRNMGPWFAPARPFGTPNQGGPLTTAGDLVFIGATTDDYFRAFDVETGRELWKHALPASGQATPLTFRTGPSHRQLVVIAAGGHGALGSPRGDYLVAFALPH